LNFCLPFIFSCQRLHWNLKTNDVRVFKKKRGNKRRITKKKRVDEKRGNLFREIGSRMDATYT
jgi:hypothetical protein